MAGAGPDRGEAVAGGTRAARPGGPLPGLWRASLRDAGRHPGQLALSLAGIALGVAVVVAVDLASASAHRAFRLSNDAVLGRTTHEIVGGSGGIPERVYARLRRAGRLPTAAPVVDGHVSVGPEPGRRMRLLGVDPLADAPFRSYPGAPSALSRETLVRLVTRPGAVAIGRSAAADLGVAAGVRLPVVAGGRPAALEVAAVLGDRSGASESLAADLLIADIATAQEILGRVGSLSRIDLIVPPGAAGERVLADLAPRLPPGLAIRPATRRAAVATDMTRAFDLNLTMMSLLALLVGMLLILNAVTFSVVRRRALIGTLRALGVTRGEVFVTVLGEAGFVGLAGTAAGLALGAWLADFLIVLVARTINDLYFPVSVTAVHLDPGSLAKGLVLGLGASLAAAAIPAREATRVPPAAAMRRSQVEASVRAATPRYLGAGLAAGLAAAVLLWWPGGGLGAGFAALFAIVAAAVLLVPPCLVGACRLADRLTSRWTGAVGALAVRGIAANLSRTGIAAAALMVALATSVGVGVMVDSFRHSVATWLGATLRADLYVATPGDDAAPALTPDLVARFAGLDGVEDVSFGRAATVEAERGPVQVVALRMAPESYRGFRFVRGESRAGWAAFDRGSLLLSEPFAYHSGLDVGDGLDLLTDRGRRRFPVAGVVRDYGSDRGVVLMSRATWERFWHDRAIGSAGIYVRDGADPDVVSAAVRRMAGTRPVVVRSNRALREASMTVFDRTFEITRVLRWLTTVVAFVGVLSALMALALERTREIGLLRALGLTPAQVWGLVELETSLLGLVAGLLAVPLGLVLALVLVGVVNRRSFGWSIDLSVDPVILVQAVGLAVAAAALAGVYPALRMAATLPAEALREE